MSELNRVVSTMTMTHSISHFPLASKMYTDQTNIFRAILSDKLGQDPTATAPSSAEPSRAGSPTGIRNRFGRKDEVKRKRRKMPRKEEEQDDMRREFLAEAYRIVSRYVATAGIPTDDTV